MSASGDAPLPFLSIPSIATVVPFHLSWVGSDSDQTSVGALYKFRLIDSLINSIAMSVCWKRNSHLLTSSADSAKKNPCVLASTLMAGPGLMQMLLSDPSSARDSTAISRSFNFRKQTLGTDEQSVRRRHQDVHWRNMYLL